MTAFDSILLDAAVSIRAAWLTPVVVGFTTVTGPTWVFLYSFLLSVALRGRGSGRGWRLAVIPPIAVGTANLTSHVLKDVFARPRPEEFAHLVTETNFAFPSGHAVGAAAGAMVITVFWRRWSVLAWIVALLVGLSRLYVGVHWPTDLVAGWLLGAGIAGCLCVLLERTFQQGNPDNKRQGSLWNKRE